MAKTIRKQFYLSQDVNGLLAEFAEEKNIPEAEVIRRALIEYLLKQYPLPEKDPLAKLAGIGASGRKPLEAMND